MLVTPAAFRAQVAADEAAATAAPLSFVFCDGGLLIHEATLDLPGADILAALGVDLAFETIGVLADAPCRAAWLPPGQSVPDGYRFTRLRALFGALDSERLAVAGRAFQIAEWARTHRFCGACGTPTIAKAGERCRQCPACGHTAYPRISPAMMVLVRRGDHILLARHTTSPAPVYTALAGFVEAGESIEECIHREVHEEVGLAVSDIRYFGSQSWPFPHSLMIAFTAEYAGGDIRTDPAEIADAQWFGPDDDIPRIPPSGVSIAGALLRSNWPGGYRRPVATPA